MSELINKIKELQIAEGLTDSDYAAKIGFVRGSYSAIKTQEVKIGLKFLKGVLRAYQNTRHYKTLLTLVEKFLLEGEG